jgi:seryl-tRNA synthetase
MEDEYCQECSYKDGQIDNLQDEIEQLRVENNELQSDLEITKNEKQKQIDELQSRIEYLQDELKEINYEYRVERARAQELEGERE